MSGYTMTQGELLYAYFGAATVTTPTTSPGSSMILTYPAIKIPAGYFTSTGERSSSLKLEMAGTATVTATIPTWQFFLYTAQLASPPVFATTSTLGSTAVFTPGQAATTVAWECVINIGLRTLALGAGSTLVTFGRFISNAFVTAAYNVAATNTVLMPGPAGTSTFATYDTSQSYTLWPALSLGAATAGNTVITNYAKLYGEN
jgi:hypothetical protein